MKFNIKYILGILLLIGGLLLSSCSLDFGNTPSESNSDQNGNTNTNTSDTSDTQTKGEVDLYIDNPTETPVSIQLGDISESIGKYQSLKVKIKPGSYDLKVDNTSVGSVTIKDDPKAFLNPTNSPYVKEYLIFSYLSDEDTDYSVLPDNDVKVNGETYYGPFEVYTGYYVTGDWDYTIDEDFPESLQLDEGMDQDMRSKLYRYDDFLNLYWMYYTDHDDGE